MGKTEPPLSKFRRRYPNDEAFRDHLVALGLEPTDRTTVHRWCNLQELPRRAQQALELLTVHYQDQTILKFAHPPTPAALPLALLYSRKTSRERDQPRRGRPQEKVPPLSRIKLVPVPVENGRMALEKLVSGEVQLALVSDELFDSGGKGGVDSRPSADDERNGSKPWTEHCVRLCHLSKIALRGIVREGKERTSDLRFGHQADTGFAAALREFYRRPTDQLRLTPITAGADAGREFQKGTIYFLVGAESWLDDASKEIEKYGDSAVPFARMNPGDCGHLTFSLFINLQNLIQTFPRGTILELMQVLRDLTRKHGRLQKCLNYLTKSESQTLVDNLPGWTLDHLITFVMTRGNAYYRLRLSTDAILALWQLDASQAGHP